MKMFSELNNEFFPRQPEVETPWYNRDVEPEKRIYEPTPEPVPEPTPEPVPEPVPEPTPEPTPEPKGE